MQQLRSVSPDVAATVARFHAAASPRTAELVRDSSVAQQSFNNTDLFQALRGLVRLPSAESREATQKLMEGVVNRLGSPTGGVANPDRQTQLRDTFALLAAALLSPGGGEWVVVPPGMAPIT